jgi:hypothetical protein
MDFERLCVKTCAVTWGATAVNGIVLFDGVTLEVGEQDIRTFFCKKTAMARPMLLPAPVIIAAVPIKRSWPA